MALIERLGYESGLWDTFIRTDSNIISYRPLMTTGQPASGGPNLSNVDAIFYMGHREIQLDDQQKADLLKFVHEDGKGFVAAHVALTSLASWPEFGEMLGGVYDDHPWGNVAGTIINEDPAFPATKHLSATFNMTDELRMCLVKRAASCCAWTSLRCPRMRVLPQRAGVKPTLHFNPATP